MKRFIISILFTCLCLTGLNVSAQGSLSSLDDLLQQVQDGTFRENQQNRAREQEFVQNRGRQQELLRQAETERANLEAESARMEREFEENELANALKSGRVTKRSCDLKYKGAYLFA